jgi:pyruvate ferredoxin oxidoreductase beta subunit
LDLEEKFARAATFTGPKLFLALSACPTGWLYDPGETPEVAKLAVETGLWPLKEAINGEVVHTYIPKRKPVEDYLRLQGRFRHLFEPSVQTETIAHIQARVNAYWQEAKKTGIAS